MQSVYHHAALHIDVDIKSYVSFQLESVISQNDFSRIDNRGAYTFFLNIDSNLQWELWNFFRFFAINFWRMMLWSHTLRSEHIESSAIAMAVLLFSLSIFSCALCSKLVNINYDAIQCRIIFDHSPFFSLLLREEFFLSCWNKISAFWQTFFVICFDSVELTLSYEWCVRYLKLWFWERNLSNPVLTCRNHFIKYSGEISCCDTIITCVFQNVCPCKQIRHHYCNYWHFSHWPARKLSLNSCHFFSFHAHGHTRAYTRERSLAMMTFIT